MTQISTSESFLVRVYRIDTQDSRKINGLVEAMDGTGEQHFFSDLEELSDIMNRSVARHGRGRRKRNKKEANEE